MDDEKHPNEDYVHAEASRPPAGTRLPPDVSAATPAGSDEDDESESENAPARPRGRGRR